MKKLLSIALLLIFVTSCDTNLRIEKRKYMKGYYVDYNRASKKTNQSFEKNEKNTIALDSNQQSGGELFAIGTKEDIEIPVSSSSKQSSKKSIQIPAKVSIKKIGEDAIAKSQTKQQTTKQKKSNKTLSYWLIAIAAGVMGVGISKTYHSKKSGMNKLKSWSVKNKRKAFALSILSRTLLMIIGFATGVKLFEMDYLFPQYTMQIGIAAYAVGLLIYLFRKSTYERFFSFLKAQLHSLVLAVTSFVMFATIGNFTANENANGINTDHHLNKRCAKFFQSKNNSSEKDINYSDAQTLKQSDDGGTIALKVVLSVLAILSILILQALTIAFSCLLICEGNEVGGVALAFGGTIAIAAISIITFYWIAKIDLNKETASPTN